jgi:hypothetical protein
VPGELQWLDQTKVLFREPLDHFGNETPERIVLDELLVELGVVLEQRPDHPHQRRVQLDPGRGRGVLLGVLVRLIRRDLRRDDVPEGRKLVIWYGCPDGFDTSFYFSRTYGRHGNFFCPDVA